MFVGAISVGGSYFGEGSGPVLAYNYCRGTESNLAQCSLGSVGQRDCHHGRNVGVICQGRVGQGVVNCYSILKTTVTGLIVTLHQHFHYK